jgi:hypothetical protein
MEPEPQKENNDFPFIKNIIFIVLFLLITPLTIGASLFSLVTFSNASETKTENLTPVVSNLLDIPKSGVSVYAALPEIQPSISGSINFEDARIELTRQLLEKYNSPLEPLSKKIVTTSDKYNLDYRLLTAIALKESGGCRVIPENSYNCWGWGIHSKGTLMFDSYEEGLDVVGKGIKEKYIDMGYTTIEEIMSKYAHASSTTWADDVVFYMDQLH